MVKTRGRLSPPRLQFGSGLFVFGNFKETRRPFITNSSLFRHEQRLQSTTFQYTADAFQPATNCCSTLQPLLITLPVSGFNASATPE